MCVSTVHCFLLLSSIPLYGCYTLFIHSLVDAHLGFQLLAITNKAAVNVPIEVFVWLYAFISLALRTCEWNCWSQGRYLFNILRPWQTGFHSGCNTLLFRQQCMRVPFAPHSNQHLVLSLKKFLKLFQY